MGTISGFLKRRVGRHITLGRKPNRPKRQSNSARCGYTLPCSKRRFSDYLADRLKAAVDAGAEAVHLEEPEFWDDSGYSEGFKREYRLFYGEDWTAPHISSEARYRASRLKVYLYKRLLSRVSESVKEYAMTKYAKRIAFYVPTHSLVNYTQWKILSPEATLLDIPTVDGCIAQVWTGNKPCRQCLCWKIR